MAARTTIRRCPRLGALLALALARTAAATTGGPDAFGYQFVDSREPGGPAFHLIDISTTGTPVIVGTAEDGGDDVASAPIDLTGGGARAGFPLYGVFWPALVMASNGYLTTDVEDPGNDIVNDCPLPQTPAVPVGTNGARIYVLHDDLVLEPGIGAGYHQYLPSAAAAGRTPDRGPDVGVHVFLWKNATQFRPPPNPDPPRFDFEALLYDNGDLVFQYGPGHPDPGATATIGIQDPPPPTTALQVACNASGAVGPGVAVWIPNPRFADVALRKTVDPPSPVAGETVTYTVVAENVGRVTAPGVRVADPLPDGLTVLAEEPSAGTFAGGVWTLPPLPPGGNAVLTVVARVGRDRGGDTIVNVATRTAIAAPLFDGEPRNDVAAAAIAVAARPPEIGHGPDRDGDGFADAFEDAAGSNPDDTEATPFGVAAAPTPLDVRRLRIRLDFRRDGRDVVRVTGRLPLASDFPLDGRTVVLDVGGVTAAFPLEARGRGARGRARGVRGRLRVGAPRGGRARFAARLTGGGFAAALAENAGLADADARRADRSVRVALLLSPVVLATEQPLRWTARAGRGGRSREAR